MNTPRITPAQSLKEVYLTLRPEPLITADELKAFYRQEVNAVRGGDKVRRLEQGLNRAYGVNYFKAFFMGHQGVGKSTELSRLAMSVTPKFRIIRFSAINNLDPRHFKSLDVVLTMMADVAEQTSKPIASGGAGKAPPEARLREIWDWFATEKYTREQAIASEVKIEGGVGGKKDSLWHTVLGLFAHLRGEMRFAFSRKKEIIDYRFNRLPDLIEIANRLLDDCNDLLKKATGHEWLFIGEDFDKPGIPSPVIEELFINYADVFRQLRTHMIFSLPISLYYSGKAVELPFAGDQSFILPDTPMFYQDHTPNSAGRLAVADVLQARMQPDLFEPGEMERLIVASGGNLRDLFALVNYAADTADLRDATTIATGDTDSAVNNLRSDYERRLGQSPYDADEIVYSDKSERMIKIYNGERDAQVTDPVVYSLLRSRAVQEFNGERWFGVHPLVVDILVKQKLIAKPSSGGVPGGSE
jgi:hypothetical protein